MDSSPFAGRHTGIAHLPLHYGKAPRWLFQRMVPLAREITTAIVTDLGPMEILRRLARWEQRATASPTSAAIARAKARGR